LFFKGLLFYFKILFISPKQFPLKMQQPTAMAIRWQTDSRIKTLLAGHSKQLFALPNSAVPTDTAMQKFFENHKLMLD
jgi:hypothetical protein